MKKIGRVAQACELVVNENLADKEHARWNLPDEISLDTTDGFIFFMVQVVLSLKNCVLERMSVLLGRYSPQLPILSRLIDEQLRFLQARCKGYATTRVCFQVWRAARHGRMAQNSEEKLLRLQVEKQALSLRLLQLAEEKDLESSSRLQHGCLLKWHQFVTTKQMVHATETRLNSATRRHGIHARQCTNLICRWLDLHENSAAHVIFNAWAVIVAAQHAAQVTEYWRADAATLHLDCNRLRTAQQDILVHAARIQESLRLMWSLLQYFVGWKYHLHMKGSMLDTLMQRATKMFIAGEVWMILFCSIKVWYLQLCLTKDSRNQATMHDFQEAYVHCVNRWRDSALRSSLRRQALRLTCSIFALWKDLHVQAGEKRCLADKRRVCLRHDANYQRLLFIWDKGNNLAMERFYLCIWAEALRTEARSKLVEIQLAEMALLQQHLANAKSQEQRYVMECNRVLIAGDSHLAIYLKQACMRAWLSCMDCEYKAEQQKKVVSEAKDREHAGSLRRIVARHEDVLESVHRLIIKERMSTLLQMSLVGWAEVLGARALDAERHKAHESRRNLASAFNASISRIFRAWDSRHALHLQRMCLGSWFSAMRIFRCEIEAETIFRAAERSLGFSKDVWCDRALQACDLGFMGSLRRVCFRGWLSVISTDRQHEEDMAKLANIEASLVVAHRRSQLTSQELAMFLQFSCLQNWKEALAQTKQHVLEAERCSTKAFEAEVMALRINVRRLEALRRQHHAQLNGVCCALQCYVLQSLLQQCFNGWKELSLRSANSRMKVHHDTELCDTYDVVCDRMVSILTWEQAKHLKSTCLLAWLDVLQVQMIQDVTEANENCQHMHQKANLDLDLTLDAWEKAKLRSLKRVVIAGWLDVMSAAAFGKSEVYAFGCQQSVREDRVLKAWDHTSLASTKRLIVHIWHGVAIAAKHVTHEATKVKEAVDLQRYAGQALVGMRCSLVKTWEQQLALSTKQACFQAMLTLIARRGMEKEAARQHHEEQLKHQHMCKIRRHAFQYERIVMMWEMDKGLGVKHACLARWLSVLHEEVRIKLETRRLAEAQQCVTLMHTARYDWALHAWERGLCVSLKHVCLRGWASVVHMGHREEEDEQLVARETFPSQNTSVLRTLLGRGRRGASILRHLHGILATAAEESDQVTQHRAASLAAGEIALRSAALPRNSPAWSEAKRAHLELEQLEGLTRHLRKGVIPALSYVEAAHGELLAALEAFTDAWDCNSSDSLQSELFQLSQSFRSFGHQTVENHAAQDDSVAVSTALSLSGSISAAEASRLRASPIAAGSDRISLSSGTPTLGSPRMTPSRVAASRFGHPPAFSLPVPFALSPPRQRLNQSPYTSPREQLNQSRTAAALEGVVCNLRSFVEERRQISRLMRNVDRSRSPG